jgi:hypothetical protein
MPMTAAAASNAARIAPSQMPFMQAARQLFEA